MMKHKIAVFLMVVLSALSMKGQEEEPFISFEIPSQNLLKFNRFLINPTFSSVREDNSYVNLYHRNQWVQFEDSPEIYLASYSGRIGDRTGFGLGLYQQKLGVISNFGILANYAYGVRLNEKMNLTFGFNLSYFSSGLDSNEIISGEVDPVLLELNNGSFLSFQPGFNISIGSFDFGAYAENLVDYNLRTSESLTDFSEKTFSGHLMYTRKFKKTTGILTDGKLSVLSRVRKQGDRDVNLSGSLIADLPKLGWIQAGYDDFYGASAGIGFNLTKRLSLGYTIEKGLNNQTENLGPTHEITFAYSFQPNLTDDRVMLDEEEQEVLAELEEKLKDKDSVISDKDEELARIRKNLEENNRVLAELIIKQDSMERAVTEDIERRFYHLMKANKTNQPQDNTAIASTQKPNTNTTGKVNRQRKTSTKTSANKSVASEENKAFKKAAKANNIRQQSVKNLKGVKGGYYIIANVYSESKKGRFYRNKFVENLGARGLDASYFKNPENNLDYVYLERYDTWQEAMDAYKSDLNNSYKQDIWIMSVENDYDRTMLAENEEKKASVPVKNTPEPKEERITAPAKKEENTTVASLNKDNEDEVKTTRITTPVPNENTVSTDIATNTADANTIENGVAEKETETKYTERITTPVKVKENPVVNTSNSTSKNEESKRVNTPISTNTNIAPKNDEIEVADLNSKSEEEIKQLYSKNTRKKRKTAKKGAIVNIATQEDGYYIIANVFSVPSNAERFVKKLKQKGLDADYFINPENNYRYVYLKKHESWNSALASYYSNLDDSYYDDIWIMRVNINYVL
ncbi:PorP/SprF family type IX secretion system membrane protein [Flavobacteriaceae bacterium M23B6Z8]